MAVTADGVPVRCWTIPGNTADTAIIRTVKCDLTGWNLHRMVWVADRGFASATNRTYLTGGGGHYIHAEKLRHTHRSRRRAGPPGPLPHRRGQPADQGSPGRPGGDGDGGTRAVRSVVCHNPEQASRDSEVRANLVAHLQHLIDGSDGWTPRRRHELVGSLKPKPGDCAATCASPPPDCYASMPRRSHAKTTWTASGCYTPPTPH